MKLIGEVIKAVASCDVLTVEVRAKRQGSAYWRPGIVSSIDVPDNPHSRRAFHIGRKVHISIKAV